MHRLSFLVVTALLLSSCKTTREVDDKEREQAINHLNLCTAAMSQNNYRQALMDCQRGVDLDPYNADLHYAIGLTYWVGFARLKEARQHLEEAVKLREKFSEAENALGSVMMAQGDYEKAIPYFERAKANLLWSTPQFAEQNLGWALYKTGHTDEGISHLKSAINMAPETCGAYDYLGTIYTDMSRDVEATQWLERYLQVCDSDKLRKFLPPGQLSNNLYKLGMASVRQGKRDQARGFFQACSDRFPTEPAALNCKKNLQLLE